MVQHGTGKTSFSLPAVHLELPDSFQKSYQLILLCPKLGKPARFAHALLGLCTTFKCHLSKGVETDVRRCRNPLRGQVVTLISSVVPPFVLNINNPNKRLSGGVVNFFRLLAKHFQFRPVFALPRRQLGNGTRLGGLMSEVHTYVGYIPNLL